MSDQPLHFLNPETKAMILVREYLSGHMAPEKLHQLLGEMLAEPQERATVLNQFATSLRTHGADETTIDGLVNQLNAQERPPAPDLPLSDLIPINPAGLPPTVAPPQADEQVASTRRFSVTAPRTPAPPGIVGLAKPRAGATPPAAAGPVQPAPVTPTRKPAPAPARKPTPAPPPPPKRTGPKTIDDYTEGKLYDMATKRDLAGRSSMNKRELFEALGLGKDKEQPSARAEQSVAPRVSPPPVPTARPQDGPLPMRILIAEDDQRIRMIYKLKLEKQGYQVLEAATGIDACKIIESAPLGGLVLDMKLPGMHGLEILSRMIEIGLTLPVVVCTAYDHIMDDPVIRSYPSLRYLTKPCPPEQVLSALEALRAAAEQST